MIGDDKVMPISIEGLRRRYQDKVSFNSALMSQTVRQTGGKGKSTRRVSRQNNTLSHATSAER
jgi:hypothetical protein